MVIFSMSSLLFIKDNCLLYILLVSFNMWLFRDGIMKEFTPNDLKILKVGEPNKDLNFQINLLLCFLGILGKYAVKFALYF